MGDYFFICEAFWPEPMRNKPRKLYTVDQYGKVEPMGLFEDAAKQQRAMAEATQRAEAYLAENERAADLESWARQNAREIYELLDALQTHLLMDGMPQTSARVKALLSRAPQEKESK